MTRRAAVRPAWVVLPTAVAVATAVAAAAAVGGLAAPRDVGLPDPGAATRVLLPAAQGARDLAAFVTVGLLVLTATCVPPGDPAHPRLLTGTRARLVAVATQTAALWALLDLVLAALVYSDASGSAFTDPGFVSAAVFFGRSFELGQYLLWGTLLAVVVTFGATLVRTVGGVGVLAALSLVGLWPVALTGHAAGTLNHDDAVNLQFLHLLGIGVWLGGLVALTVAHRALGPALAPTARRYSTLAGVALVLVTFSGVVGAWLRVRQVDGLWSQYGLLLGLKTVAVVGLAGAGWWQRRRLLARLDAGGSRAFLRLVVLEVVVLAGAAGLGVALGRTAPPPPPGSTEPLTPAQSLLGDDLPPPLTASAWLTRWDVDSLWLAVGLAAIVLYLSAVVRLRRRGDTWPLLRSICWGLGWVLMLWATNGAPGDYGRVLFSMHMVQHMTIAMAVPTFLVLGAPVTLALRALRRRADGSLGPREWLLRVVHSLPVKVLGQPVVAAGSFVVSTVAFYYSSAFATALESHTAHILMTVHFLVSGYFFAECVIGIDPGVRRPEYPLRALLIMVTFGFHALFSVSLMAREDVLAESWFSVLGRTWGASMSEDQYLGASIGWVLGEYPLGVMAVALLVSWVQADGRERRRFDRREDRDGDRELAAYNERLARLREAGGAHGRSGDAGKRGDTQETRPTSGR